MLRQVLKAGVRLGLMAVAMGAVQTASAGNILNGGFEAFPDFQSWSTLGNTSVQDNTFKTPTEGSVQAVLSNGFNGPGAGTATTNVASLEAFLNLNPGSLVPNIKSGSAIKQSFFGTVGDVITYTYDYVTNEGPKADYGFYTFTQPGGGDFVGVLGQTGDPGLHATSALDNLSGYFNQETGYRTGTFTLTSTGTWTVGFGVVNRDDTNISSGLLVDNVQGGTGGAVGVPLPAGMYILPFGLIAAGVYSKKLRRAVAC